MGLSAIAFIGSVGIPNRYGGFEAFLEQCAPEIANRGIRVTVTCDASVYSDRGAYSGVERIFIPIRANGALSVIHDLFAFLTVFPGSSHIVVLGVSGGPWFPLFRLLCEIFSKKLIVNIDGVEWQRGKFGPFRRILLRVFDFLAQRCSHRVVYDNDGLASFLIQRAVPTAVMIPYSGDHVIRDASVSMRRGTALTICRIVPENNIELLLEGAVSSSLVEYTIIGNWDNSAYGKALRASYQQHRRLRLLDPIYDPVSLAKLRESCEFYIHGHSVGGTNPSLVEMLFYDCALLCFDVEFHRQTAGESASYFRNSEQLAKLLSAENIWNPDRTAVRTRYTKCTIADAYVSACASCM